MNKVRVYIAQPGDVVGFRNLPMTDSGVILDRKGERRGFFASADTAVPLTRRSMGFEEKGTLYIANERVAETMPITWDPEDKNTRKNRLNPDLLNEIEDLKFTQTLHSFKDGDKEPDHARYLSIGVLILICAIVGVGAVLAASMMGYIGA